MFLENANNTKQNFTAVRWQNAYPGSQSKVDSSGVDTKFLLDLELSKLESHPNSFSLKKKKIETL